MFSLRAEGRHFGYGASWTADIAQRGQGDVPRGLPAAAGRAPAAAAPGRAGAARADDPLVRQRRGEHGARHGRRGRGGGAGEEGGDAALRAVAALLGQLDDLRRGPVPLLPAPRTAAAPPSPCLRAAPSRVGRARPALGHREPPVPGLAAALQGRLGLRHAAPRSTRWRSCAAPTSEWRWRSSPPATRAPPTGARPSAAWRPACCAGCARARVESWRPAPMRQGRVRRLWPHMRTKLVERGHVGGRQAAVACRRASSSARYSGVGGTSAGLLIDHVVGDRADAAPVVLDRHLAGAGTRSPRPPSRPAPRVSSLRSS